MAELIRPGFCRTPCEIDAYADNTKVLNMGVAVDTYLEPNLSRQSKWQTIADYQGHLVEECADSASATPCPGYGEDDSGFTVIETVVPVQCPVAKRILARIICFDD